MASGMPLAPLACFFTGGAHDPWIFNFEREMYYNE
jgi:hypothetical protein